MLREIKLKKLQALKTCSGVRHEALNAMARLQCNFYNYWEDVVPPNFYMKDLFENNLMIGWCWETSQFLAPLIEGAEVKRGVLRQFNNIGDKREFDHGWVEKDGVCVDPALKIICDRPDYYAAMDPKVMVHIRGECIKNHLLSMDTGDASFINSSHKMNDLIIGHNGFRYYLDATKGKINNLIISRFVEPDEDIMI
jgi:hypothetical protein